MSTLSLVIKTQKDPTTFKKTGQPRSNMNRIINLLTSIMMGGAQGSVSVQSSSTDPVAAAATATITYASIADGDTIVILGVTLTCRTGTPTTDEFKKQTDATTTAANLVTAIGANATLAKYVTATSALGVVTITANTKGSFANYWKDITATGTGIALVQWTGGTGGAETSAVVIRG